MNSGSTVKAAFDQAVADLPSCLSCMRFEGEESFAVVPVVKRGVNLEGLLEDLLRQFREDGFFPLIRSQKGSSKRPKS